MKTLLLFSILSMTALVYGQKLEVEGDIKMSSSEDPNPAPGTIRWTGTDFQGWNGIIWVSLTGNSTVGSVMDVDGNTYQTIRIGNQEWLVDNLRTTKYRGGTNIDQITSDAIWTGLTSGAWCWYDNLMINEDPYGKLYNWYATSGDSLCPTGWHVPTDEAWVTITEFLGGEFVSGGKMKEIGTAHWTDPNQGATNESGFTALPGGYRHLDGSFLDQGNYGYWWSSTASQTDATSAWYRYLYYDDDHIGRNIIDRRHGHSIRCVR